MDENLLRFLNNYFVQTKEGLWKSPSVDSQSEQLENLIEKEVQKRVARALAGMKGGLTKARNRKNQNSPVFDEEISVNEVPEEQQTIGEEPEEIKQTSGKPLANGYQTPSKTVANGWQSSSKVVANAKQTSSKPLANGYQTPSKTVANGWQSSSKVVANAKQTAGKNLANENFATTQEPQPVDFEEEPENLPNTAEFESEAGPSLAHVCASDNPINPISDSFLINKKIKNKSESVSESVKEKTENFKNQNSREIEKFSAGKTWALQEAQTLLVDSGLDKKFLEAWVSRSDRNQTRFNALLSDVLPRFDREAFDQLIARCKEQKRSEGAMFAGSIAYVISSLEREKVTVKRRKKKIERDYTEGLIQNPDGSWSPDPAYVPRKKKYSDRDWTEGLIKNPDGSYSLDPNYER
ncbi:hypothetical protein GMD37_12245 [Parasutterella excrementihominis]|uniref:hypothetical protein n=1 Tax=Parasutterella excrementihominis TaxID=487175 RepID=UPI0012BD10E3|nr:hypothetical protein [Parasutterella excrementihominis]MTT66971.1 hypothetical protein [Parasutterella excrementihominis]